MRTIEIFFFKIRLIFIIGLYFIYIRIIITYYNCFLNKIKFELVAQDLYIYIYNKHVSECSYEHAYEHFMNICKRGIAS